MELSSQNGIDYNLSSKEAASLLVISQKTLIRWAQQEKFSYVQIQTTRGPRYRFSEYELNAFQKGIPLEINDTKQQKEDIENQKNNFDKVGDISQKKENQPKKEQKIATRGEGDAESVYKDLFFKKDEEVKQLNEQLQKASYKVAQLEEQIKTRIPLIEHNMNIEKLDSKNQTMEARLSQINKKLEKERIINVAFFLISGLILLEATIYLLF